MSTTHFHPSGAHTDVDIPIAFTVDQCDDTLEPYFPIHPSPIFYSPPEEPARASLDDANTSSPLPSLQEISTPIFSYSDPVKVSEQGCDSEPEVSSQCDEKDTLSVEDSSGEEEVQLYTETLEFLESPCRDTCEDDNDCSLDPAGSEAGIIPPDEISSSHSSFLFPNPHSFNVVSELITPSADPLALLPKFSCTSLQEHEPLDPFLGNVEMEPSGGEWLAMMKAIVRSTSSSLPVLSLKD